LKERMNPNNYMAQLGATLVDRGYAILPIQPSTKKPGMFRLGAWQDYPKWSRHCERDTTENEVDIWGDWPEAGIGIAAGRVIGIDIDVLQSKDIAVQIEGLAKRLLGDTPAVRIGNAPKRLLVYRAAQPFSGFKYPPIEVLGVGQQFIAYGIHPDTGRPYEWPVQTLADLQMEELPVITEAQAREFARQAYELVPESMRPKSLAVGLKSPVAFANLPEQRGTLEAVQDALQYIPNQELDYDSWVRMPSGGGRSLSPGLRRPPKTMPRPPLKAGRAFLPSALGRAPFTSWRWTTAGFRMLTCNSTVKL
jgi:hypothetical protein